MALPFASGLGRPALAGVSAGLLGLVRSGSAGIFAARIGGAALAWASGLAAARLLGAEAYGHYALALVTLTLLGHLANAGLTAALCRHGAAALATGDLPAARGCFTAGLAVPLATAACTALAGLAILRLLPGLVGPGAWWPLALAVGATPLLALQDAQEAMGRALGRPAAGIGPAYLLRNVATLAGFAGLAFLPVPASPSLAVGIAIGGLAAGLAGQAILLRPILRDRLPPGPRRFDGRAWLGTALPSAASDATDIALANADVLLVGALLPPAEVAAYYAATRLTLLLDLVRYAASAAATHRFAAFEALDRRPEAARLAGRVTLGSAALCAIGAVLLSIGADPLLSLFGPGFAIAAPVVPIVAAGLVVGCLCGPGSDVLAMMGEARAAAVVAALTLLGAVGLGLGLVPAFGIVGAAATAAIANAGRAAALSWLCWRRLGILLPAGRIRVPARAARRRRTSQTGPSMPM